MSRSTASARGDAHLPRPGFFGWRSNEAGSGLYWGWIGEWPDWPQEGNPNLNLAISTTGTVATVLALLGAALLLPGKLLGPDGLNDRQRFHGRVLLVLGLLALVLAWGWHTPLYRPLFDHLPLMDKWRNPLKWIEDFIFALVPLSALGAGHLLRTLDAEAAARAVLRRRAMVFLGIVFALAVLGLLATYPLAILLAARLQKQNLDGPTIANIMATMHTAMLWPCGLVLLMGLVLFAAWRVETLRRWKAINPLVQAVWQAMLQPAHLPLTVSLALAALGVAHLGWVVRQFVQPYSLADLTATNPLLEALKAEGDRVRCTVAVDDTTLQILLENQFAAMDISSLDISAASRIPDDLNAFFHAFDNDHARLWLLAGVKNVVVPEPSLAALRQVPDLATNIDQIVGYTLAPTPSPDVPSHALVTLKDFLAKATFVPTADVVAGDAVFKRLTDPHWDPRGSVLLDHAAPRRRRPPACARSPTASTSRPTRPPRSSSPPTPCVAATS